MNKKTIAITTLTAITVAGAAFGVIPAVASTLTPATNPATSSETQTLSTDTVEKKTAVRTAPAVSEAEGTKTVKDVEPVLPVLPETVTPVIPDSTVQVEAQKETITTPVATTTPKAPAVEKTPTAPAAPKPVTPTAPVAKTPVEVTPTAPTPPVAPVVEQPQAPAAFTLSCKNTGSTPNQNAELSWTPVEGATEYWVVNTSTGTNTSGMAITRVGAVTTHVLAREGWYYDAPWTTTFTVEAIDSNGKQINKSNPQVIRYEAAPAPALGSQMRDSFCN